MKKEFNPQEWLDKAKADPSRQPSSSIPGGQASSDTASEVDQVVTRIEADLVDITPSYAEWLNLGFAFAGEFGEGGRTFYHRVSRFYPGYTKAETDQQYDRCLKSQGHGITIKSFFHLAKQAGVEVGTMGRGGERTMGRGGERAMGRDREDDQGANGTSGSDQSQYAEAPNRGCKLNSV